MSTSEDRTRLEALLDSNPERDRAVRKLGEQLERLEPAKRLDVEQLLSMAVDERVAKLLTCLPANTGTLPTRADFKRQKKAAERAQRLHDAEINNALTEQDLEWLVGDGVPPDPSDSLRCIWKWQQRRWEGMPDFSVLVLLGLKGRGKTVAGAWLLAHYGPGVYCTAEQLRASFKSNFPAERELYRRALQTRVLFVDELGRESDRVTADAALFDVINSRRGRTKLEDEPGLPAHMRLRFQRWTLLASNLDEKDFRARYDESTVDRIEQQGAIFTAKGDNRRVRLVDRIKRGGGAP